MLIGGSISYLNHETGLLFFDCRFSFEKSGAHILVIKAPIFYEFIPVTEAGG